MEIYLKFRDGVVQKATYFTDGCGSSALCGSFAAELAMGRNPDEVCRITGADVLKELGTSPKDEEHCAALAAETDEEARYLFTTQQQAFVNLRRGRPGLVPPPLESASAIDDYCTPAEKHMIDSTLACRAVGAFQTGEDRCAST